MRVDTMVLMKVVDSAELKAGSLAVGLVALRVERMADMMADMMVVVRVDKKEVSMVALSVSS